MTTYSIGFYRNDGDFHILATLNNNDGYFSKQHFEEIKENLLKETGGVIAIPRQDAPDYITIDEGE